MPTENNSSVTESAARIHVAHEMRNLRLRRGLTQRELAIALAIKPSMLSHIECANRNVAYETAHAALDLAREHFKAATPPSPAPAEVDNMTQSQIDAARTKLSADVRAYRQAHTLTHKDLARYFDVSEGHLYRICTGQGSVSPELMARVYALMKTAPTIRPTGRGYERPGARVEQAAPAPAPGPAPTQSAAEAAPAQRTDMAATFLRLDSNELRGPLVSALVFDGTTPHYFVRTVDNGIVILRAKA